jgi:Immunoglobulin I-set domain
VKPRIDRTNLKTTTIRVGKQIFLDVDVAGEPAPDIKWFLLGKEVTATDRLSVDNVPYNTKLKIVDGKRADTGKYRIVATNEHGSDEEVVELVVLGAPSKPMGKYLYFS